jgi:hypothetical protein
MTTLAESSVDTFPLTHNQREAAEELARPSCPRCGIPRSDYDGHWCHPEGGREQWRGWDG